MTEEEKSEIIQKVIEECRSGARPIFQKMVDQTMSDELAIHGLHAYIFGFLEPMLVSMYANGDPETEGYVSKTILELMAVIKTKYEAERGKRPDAPDPTRH